MHIRILSRLVAEQREQRVRGCVLVQKVVARGFSMSNIECGNNVQGPLDIIFGVQELGAGTYFIYIYSGCGKGAGTFLIFIFPKSAARTWGCAMIYKQYDMSTSLSTSAKMF